MPMTVVVTRNASPRTRGFLASCMLEAAPGVYTSPRMNAGVGERVWAVVSDWTLGVEGASAVLLWQDSREPSGQGLLVVGEPARDLVEHEGFILSRRRPSEE